MLLQLEEQRDIIVTPEKQRDKRKQPNAPDADHLVRDVGEHVAGHGLALVVEQGLGIRGDDAPHKRSRILVGDPGEDRRPVGELQATVHRLCQASQEPAVVARRRVGEHAFDLAAEIATRDFLDESIDVDPRVPGGEVGSPSEVAHPCAVAAEGREGRRADVGPREAQLAGRDDDAGCETLDVPLPGARVRLVEVVDVEHEATGRGRRSRQNS